VTSSAQASIAEVADVLGVWTSRHRAPTALELMEQIEKGLPVASLNRVTATIAPRDAGFKYRIVPKATLARIKQHRHRLNASQGSLVARLADVWSLSRKVWGSDQEARDFLFRPHQILAGRRPIEVAMANEIGAQLVRDILGRLQHGSAV
jgi:putative toxin-antitoxin system antitoxin component (TIGR02293 family)